MIIVRRVRAVIVGCMDTRRLGPLGQPDGPPTLRASGKDPQWPTA